MPANPWQLRADVRPLEVAAARWAEVSALMASRGDEIVSAAQRATEGWDAVAADSYEQHRRQVLAHLDRFTTLASEISGSLRAIGSILTASQEELDRAWTTVALVPHQEVGESRVLVFAPEDDDGRGKVDTGKVETEEIRNRLALALDQESARLRASRAELVTVRTELTTLSGGMFGRRVGPGIGPAFGAVGEESGVGTVLPSTSVPGLAQSGVSAAGLPPVAAISVDMPRLTGLSAAALTPFVAGAAGGLAGRSGRPASTGTPPPAGGMGMGAMGARAGTMSRGMASGRAGARRLSTPRLEREDDATAADRAKQAERDAKRAALEEKRAERAARRAERARDKDKDKNDEKEREDGTDEEPIPDEGERAVLTVVEVAAGDEPPTSDAPDADPATEVDAGGAEDVRRS